MGKPVSKNPLDPDEVTELSNPYLRGGPYRGPGPTPADIQPEVPRHVDSHPPPVLAEGRVHDGHEGGQAPGDTGLPETEGTQFQPSGTAPSWRSPPGGAGCPPYRWGTERPA